MAKNNVGAWNPDYLKANKRRREDPVMTEKEKAEGRALVEQAIRENPHILKRYDLAGNEIN